MSVRQPVLVAPTPVGVSFSVDSFSSDQEDLHLCVGVDQWSICDLVVSENSDLPLSRLMSERVG